MGIYLTSDFHFCHNKEFAYKPRGFESVEDMNNAIVNNYNNVISDDDIVYILGDCMLNDNTKGIEYLKQLKGHKYLAIGNHETDNRIEAYKEANVFEDIQYAYRFVYKHISFYCTHYPTMVANEGYDKPIVCVCGHTHSPDKFQNISHHCYNVACDANNCTPVGIDTIIQDFKDYLAVNRLCEHQTDSPQPRCPSCQHKSECDIEGNIHYYYDRNQQCKYFKLQENI